MFGRGQQGRGGGGSGGGAGVCRFYQQGRCRYGDNCKFEHPGAQRQPETNNRYQPLENQGNNYNNNARNQQRPSAPGRGQQYTNQSTPPFSVTREGIEADMKEERPRWPLSCYGPGKDAPRQLFGGFPLEQSPEEMRLQYYQLAATGNKQAAEQSENEMLTLSNQQVQKVLADLDGAVGYVVSGQNEHPNRIDMCHGPGTSGGVFAKGRQPNPAYNYNPHSNQGANSNPFGAPQVAQTGGFGAPSQPAQAGGFGAPSQPHSSGFGQPSTLGQNGGSGFGAPSALGAKPNPFVTSGVGFGAPSAIGAKPNPFGQPLQPSGGAQSSPFSQFAPPQNQQNGGTQPSPFGTNPVQQNTPFAAAAQPGVSTFGTPSVPGGGSTFGNPSAPGQQGASPFAQTANQGSTFGNPSVPNQGSTFGQPSIPSQQSGGFAGPSPFAQAAPQQNAAPANPFGAPPAQNQGNAFGNPSAPNPQPSPFAQPAAQTQSGGFGSASPFAQPAAAQQPAANPFGQPNAQSAQAPSQASANHTPAPNTANTGANPNPTWLTRNANSTLQSFKNRPVVYQNNIPHYRAQDGHLERIFHPNGVPAKKPGVDVAEEKYTPEIVEAYRIVAEQGIFPGGVMPEEPPKYEWIRWDL